MADPFHRADAGPLAGVRVVDFTWVMAGPFCTRVLADFGAEVLKIEQPGRGDIFRVGDPTGRYPTFMFLNYGKQSIALDLKQPAATAVVRDLVALSDVVVENFRPGTMDRLGLGYDALRRVNPSIVYCSISGFGQDGPLAGRSLHAPMTHALSGIMETIGMPDTPPMQPPAALADPNAGVHAATAIIAALFRRSRTGFGERIDLAMLDALFWLMGPTAERLSLDGTDADLGRPGIRNRSTVPIGTFATRNGWVVLGGGVDDVDWGRLVRAIGRPELADRPHSWRREHQSEVYGMIEDWAATFATASEIEAYLLEQGCLAGRVRTVKEAMADPQMRHRAMIDLVEDDPYLPPYEAVNSPWRFSESPVGRRGLPPTLGEHGPAILAGLLGYAADQVHELIREGVVGTPSAN